MLNKKQLKIEIKNIKNLCKGSESFESLHNTLDKEYERISNRKDKSYNSEYNIVEILKGKTLKEFEVLRSKNGQSGIVFEFIKYLKAPKGFVFIYNEFINGIQEHIDIYIIKQGENIC